MPTPVVHGPGWGTNSSYMLDLRQLHYFVVVVEEGQMTRASARLHIAQPALSQAIGKLEIELGVKLLERHARGVTTTEAGEAFLEKAARALLAVEEAEDALRPWRPGAPQLKVGFSQSAGDLARGVLTRFMVSRPDVDLQIRHLEPAERLVQLRRGKIDAELIYPPPRDEGLLECVVAVCPRYVILSERHPLAADSSLVFSQIEGETLPARHPSVAEELVHDAWLMRYRERPPRLAGTAPTSLDELWTLVARGKAIAILPEFAVERAQGDGVRAIPLVDVDPLEVCLAVRSGDIRPEVSALIAALAEDAPTDERGSRRKSPPGQAKRRNLPRRAPSQHKRCL
jgi:DNA-binding transcriptional LysR family regulator